MDVKRILLIDDEKPFTQLVRLNLERMEKYKVCEVNDPTTALEAARNFRPHLILLDVVMPDMDGGDVASLLHADPQTRDIPIVFLTCLVPHEGTELNGVVSGSNLFLPKPTDVSELIEVIESRLQTPPPAQ